MELKHPRILTGLTLVLALFLAIASFYGAFVPATYSRDSVSMGTQGAGQDVFDLFVVVPLLVTALVFTLRGNLIALMVLGGSVFFVLYSYILYAFGVHFNGLFLVYCTVLGTSLYGFLVCITELNELQVQRWLGERAPIRSIGIFFLVVAVIFYLLWFKDVVPAILTDTIPTTVADNDLLVNPVHVLDIAVALPGLIVTAILLLRKHPLGYVFTPVYLIFIILIALALVAMVVALKKKGIAEDFSIAWIFILLALLGGGLLFQYFRAIGVKSI